MGEMKKIYDTLREEEQIAIYSDGERYEVFWISSGIGCPEVREPVPKEAVESFLRKEHTASELINYAIDGVWKPKMSQEESSREFLRESPYLLLKIPDNQKHFSKEELEELMPKAREDLIRAERQLKEEEEQEAKERAARRELIKQRQFLRENPDLLITEPENQQQEQEE